MTVRRISIFLPRPTQFYQHLLGQIQRGFEAVGVEASGALTHLGADDMRQWCAKHRPDVVFEMNRPKCDVPFLPKGIRHVVWVVDFNGRRLAHFEGSDITYLFGPGWPPMYPHSGFHRWLGPGADEASYAFAPHRPEITASFVGHIPRPWTQQELNRDLTGSDAGFTFGDLLPLVEPWLRTDPKTRRPQVADAIAFADQACKKATGRPLCADAVLNYDINGRIVRDVRRRDLADTLLKHLTPEFYGPENWAQWPKYAPHYRGYLDEPQAMRSVYQRSVLNVHEGNGIHFRSMDIMSTGGLLFSRQHWYDDHKPGGLATVFEPHVDYVPFTLETMGEVANTYLSDPQRAARIRSSAAEKIATGHTWRHRAAEIVGDLNQLG